MKFVDTNIFVRFLTRDDIAKAEASGALIAGLNGSEEEMMTSEMVIGEVVYVLSSRGNYGLSASDIRDRLRPVVESRGLKLGGKGVILRALDIYSTYPFLDFEDVLSVAHMEAAGIHEILSYDRGFDRVEGIVRVEP